MVSSLLVNSPTEAQATAELIDLKLLFCLQECKRDVRLPNIKTKQTKTCHVINHIISTKILTDDWQETSWIIGQIFQEVTFLSIS